MKIVETEKGYKIETESGYLLPVEFTKATTREQLLRFCELAKASSIETHAKARQEKLEWNWKPENKGRNWPEFALYEREMNRLCREAGIKDS